MKRFIERLRWRRQERRRLARKKALELKLLGVHMHHAKPRSALK